MRDRFGRNQARGLVISVRVVDANHVDRALFEVAAVGLNRIATWSHVWRDLDGGIAMRLMRCRRFVGLLRTVGTVVIGDSGDRARL